jgi:alpha-1,3/alpha-1,6-mannosyltransferase
VSSLVTLSVRTFVCLCVFLCCLLAVDLVTDGYKPLSRLHVSLPNTTLHCLYQIPWCITVWSTFRCRSCTTKQPHTHTLTHTHTITTTATKALLAALRCVVVAIWVCLFRGCDLAIVDIVSLPVVVFAIFRVPVLFYCHFPDKTLEQTIRKAPSSSLRRVYRRVIDSIEYFALKQATLVVCNSNFTRRVFCETYPSLPAPGVVYPCVQLDSERNAVQLDSERNAVRNPVARKDTRRLALGGTDRSNDTAKNAACDARSDTGNHIYLVSLNRFERKKNIVLAIEAMQLALKQLSVLKHHRKLRLIIAGGFDSRLTENVQHYAELEELIVAYSLQDHVELRRNVSDNDIRALISRALALLYTPRDEHFGIVPLEAMALGTAVIAANSGGPMESVVDTETGYLRQPTPEAFAEAVVSLARDPDLATEMGRCGRERVNALFSLHALAGRLEPILRECSAKSQYSG